MLHNGFARLRGSKIDPFAPRPSRNCLKQLLKRSTEEERPVIFLIPRAYASEVSAKGSPCNLRISATGGLSCRARSAIRFGHNQTSA